LQHKCSQECENIVKIKDVYYNCVKENPSLIYIVMEYFEGGELFYKIKNSYESSSITEQEVARIMFQICSAVQHMHHLGIAHRDLKPENIVLSSKNNDANIKLIDFGFSKEVKYGLTTPS
jgi:serine/threonine protein kinase